MFDDFRGVYQVVGNVGLLKLQANNVHFINPETDIGRLRHSVEPYNSLALDPLKVGYNIFVGFLGGHLQGGIDPEGQASSEV